MMSYNSLKDLNKLRSNKYKKSEEKEAFLKRFNESLTKLELEQYKDFGVPYPFIFSFGIPRTGSTLLSQFIVRSFDLGYINNIAARFYRAPLTGIKFSNSIMDLNLSKNELFKNKYSQTSSMLDVHEFGYFWRYWLKKELVEDFKNYKDQEDNIEWDNLNKCLSSIMNYFNKPVYFKNIFGAFHMKKLVEILNKKVLFIYMERDDIDTACSIYRARQNYFPDNLETWWSTIPPQFEQLVNLSPEKQIVGQVKHLKQLYISQLSELNESNFIKIQYQDLCENPKNVLMQIQKHINTFLGYQIAIKDIDYSNIKYVDHSGSEMHKRFKSIINTL